MEKIQAYKLTEVFNLKSEPLLSKYNKKRNFEKTNEPEGTVKTVTNQHTEKKLRNFVVQKHDATRLHYDFRLESQDGVLKSWAVPKGPSVNPKIKRLAVMVEDHPFDYLHFEGTIPKGNYGAGTVIVWDTGSYSSREPILKQIDEGKVTVELYGNKLKGLFKLIKTKKENQWLLFKVQDKFASEDDLTVLSPESVLSSKTMPDMQSEPEAILGSKLKASKKSKSASKKARSKGNIAFNLFPKIKPMLLGQSY